VVVDDTGDKCSGNKRGGRMGKALCQKGKNRYTEKKAGIETAELRISSCQVGKVSRCALGSEGDPKKGGFGRMMPGVGGGGSNGKWGGKRMAIRKNLV